MHPNHLALDPGLVRELQAARFDRLRARSARPRAALRGQAPKSGRVRAAAASATVIDLTDVDRTLAGACR